MALTWRSIRRDGTIDLTSGGSASYMFYSTRVIRSCVVSVMFEGGVGRLSQGNVQNQAECGGIRAGGAALVSSSGNARSRQGYRRPATEISASLLNYGWNVSSPAMPDSLTIKNNCQR